jgi:hypothetical protein
MSPCTLLLLCCALAAAADPPADKKDAVDRYAPRLAAAAAVVDPASRVRAYLAIAVDAAEAGQDDVVKKCLAEYPKKLDIGDQDEAFYALFIRLAGAGYETEAVEAAKGLPTGLYRDKTLGQLAAGRSPTGVAAFWRACEDGNDERVDALWATTPLNAKDRNGETGLMKASANGHVAVVKRLLGGQHVELWEVDKQGRTALMKAAENGQDAVVRAIFGRYTLKPYPKDEPFNLTDLHGQTALMLAAAKGHAGVVRVLLDVRYANPLMNDRLLTIEREGGPAIVSPLDAPLVDRERKDNDGKTALDLAEAGKHAGVVELLKKAGQ